MGWRTWIFEGGGAFVPEEGAALIPAGVGEAHGIAAGEAAFEADAEAVGIGEAVGLLMAGGAGDGLVEGEAFVVEEDAAEGGAGVGGGIFGRRVVLFEDGIDVEGGREKWVCVIECSDGDAEGEVERSWNGGGKKSAVKEVVAGDGRWGGFEVAVVNLNVLDFGPVDEIGGGLDGPGLVGGVADADADGGGVVADGEGGVGVLGEAGKLHAR